MSHVQIVSLPDTLIYLTRTKAHNIPSVSPGPTTSGSCRNGGKEWRLDGLGTGSQTSSLCGIAMYGFVSTLGNPQTTSTRCVREPEWPLLCTGMPPTNCSYPWSICPGPDGGCFVATSRVGPFGKSTHAGLDIQFRNCAVP